MVSKDFDYFCYKSSILMYFKQQVIILSPEFKDINDGFSMNFHRTKKDGFPWSLGTKPKNCSQWDLKS